MSEAAVSYAAIILADADVEITSEKLLALTSAAGIEDVEPVCDSFEMWEMWECERRDVNVTRECSGSIDAWERLFGVCCQ